jgi:hypothetical protein
MNEQKYPQETWKICLKIQDKNREKKEQNNSLYFPNSLCAWPIWDHFITAPNLVTTSGLKKYGSPTQECQNFPLGFQP